MLVLSPELAFCSNQRTARVLSSYHFPFIWKAHARTLTPAHLLLKSADGWSTSALVTAFDACEATVTNVRRHFTQGGLEAVLHDKVQQCRRSALSGLQTAHLIAIACSPSPDGHDRLPGAPLGAKSGRVGLCDKHFAYYHSRNAEKNELKPWQHEHWCLPSVGGEAGRSHGRCAGSL